MIWRDIFVLSDVLRFIKRIPPELPLLGLTEDEQQNQKLVEVLPRFDGKA